MTVALQIALTATPLASYFYALGFFHSGRRPRLISGSLDVAMLSLGLGGLVTFGPFGRAVMGRLVGPDASLVAWAIWVGVVMLWALVLVGSATLRVTVYQIRPEDLDQAVWKALKSLNGHYSRTLTGFEDAKRGAGLTVKSTHWFRSGSVEAYGQHPDVLMRDFKPKLRLVLSELPQQESSVSTLMFVSACLTMLVPVASYFYLHPKVWEALRAFLQSMKWW